MSWILPLALAVLVSVLHRFAATRSRALASAGGEPLPTPNASYPALALTEVAAVGLVAAAIVDAPGPPLLVSAMGAVVLALGLFAPLVPRVAGRSSFPPWMRAIARVWPTGDADGDARGDAPIAVAHDVDPFEERVLVERVNRLGDTDIAEVMVPRGDVIAVDQGADVRGFVEVFEVHRHSRYPVIDGDLDRVTGVVSAFDLRTGETEAPLSSFAKPATMVPEAKSAVELLDEMSRGADNFAVVVDEFGGTSGVVTMEDLVEQLVGEIWDEHERVEVRMRRVGKDVYVSEASMPLNEVELRLGIRFPEGDYETIAGYLLEEFGRIPVRGDTVSYEGMIFEVLTADRRRIESVQIDLRGRKART